MSTGLWRRDGNTATHGERLIEIFCEGGADRLRQHRQMFVIGVIETGNHPIAGGLKAGDLAIGEGKSNKLDG